jgi:hypothetical protein
VNLEHAVCVQDLCSDISRELVPDLSDSSRLGAIPRRFSVHECVKMSRANYASHLHWIEVTSIAHAGGFGMLCSRH